MTGVFRFLLVVVASFLMASCGGGGGCAGTPTNGTNTCNGTTATTTTTTGAPAVASFVFTLDKSAIFNTGTDVALLTITALDASRNVVAGVPIQVSLDTGVYQPLAAITDASGQAKGNIGIGQDKSNRTITATFTDGSGLSGTASVVVTGAKISITPVPATPAPSTSVQINVKATDSNGAGIPGASIQLGGTLGFTQAITTDPTGNATATITAPATANTYTVTAAGLGVSTTQAVVVSGGAGGLIPVAVGPISGSVLAINPTTISPNLTGGTLNRSALKATFFDANNQPIPNVRVRFEIMPPGLGSGEYISTGATTVYSDSAGNATADYIAGTRTSPTNGVVIRACYGLTDADIAGTLCPASVQNTLTVAGQPVSIALGHNNLLLKTNGGLSYGQRILVTVTDAAGVAVSGAVVSASVDITHYGKGHAYSDPYYINNLTTLLILPPIFGQAGINSTDMPVAGVPGRRVWCINEDLNRNGVADTGEDINGNAMLDPRKADVKIAYVNGNTTASDGTLELEVGWPQQVATWLSFTVKATTSVGGTEGMVQESFMTTFIKGDEVNGSFLIPPYGFENCISPN